MFMYFFIWTVSVFWTCSIYSGHVFYSLELVLLLAWTYEWIISFMISLLFGKLCSSFVVDIWYVYFICGMWYVCVSVSNYTPSIYHVFWRLEETICAYTVIILYAFHAYMGCIELTWYILFICYYWCILLICHIWYMHVYRGSFAWVSSQFICDNSMCFVIIKKGEIVGPKAISPSYL